MVEGQKTINSMQQKIILVDENDKELGVGDKLKIHREGKLHRAFSVLIFNSKGELLLQKRAKNKYHSAGLWTNTCCSHPAPEESLEESARRRLKEEMGFVCPLERFFAFIYGIKLDNNLFEYEYDHILVGKFDGEPKPNPKEAESWKWTKIEDLERDIRLFPEIYTAWFKILLERITLRDLILSYES